MDADKQAQLDKERWEILYGGADIEVSRVVRTPDTDGDLVPETVKVRKIPVRQMGALAKAFGNVIQELVVYTSKDPTYFDDLTDDSILAIVTEGRRLNTKAFAAWFALQKQAAETLTGKSIDLDAEVTKAIEAKASASA